MLLKIFELINKLQVEIGNNAEVRIFARDDALFIRVDWWDDDFHAQREFKEKQLVKFIDDASKPLDHFVSSCKDAYARKAG